MGRRILSFSFTSSPLYTYNETIISKKIIFIYDLLCKSEKEEVNNELERKFTTGGTLCGGGTA